MYINQTRDSHYDTPKLSQDEEGGVCYAHALATVMHLAMKRIHSRKGGYPDFYQLKDDLIKEYGTEGANTEWVLAETCPRYRLHFKKVDETEAMQAIVAKRPCVAKFRLSLSEWDTFNGFFGENPTKILSKQELNIKKRKAGEKTTGHAVVLTSFDGTGLRFMNSFGHKWGDGGFFKVRV